MVVLTFRYYILKHGKDNNIGVGVRSVAAVGGAVSEGGADVGATDEDQLLVEEQVQCPPPSDA